MIKPKQILTFIFISVFFVNAQQTQNNKDIYEIKTKTKHLSFGIEQKIPLNNPIVGVALSGGGARGFAQIGVLKALLENDINIDIITSTSMGSIVGGLYSMGYSIQEIDSMAKNTNWEDFIKLNSKTDRSDLYVDQKITEDKAIFSLRLNGFKPVIPTSLNDGEKISNYLNLVTLKAPIHIDYSFDELKTKYRAVCTDLLSGKPIVLNSGSLSQAMRASASVSFLLSPINLDTLMLVDGGLIANIPVTYAKDLGAEYIIAVNTTSKLHKKEDLDLPWIIADQVVSIPMKELNTQQLKKANLVISPDLDRHLAEDFKNIETIIEKGYKTAKIEQEGLKKHLDSLSAIKIAGELKSYKNLTLNNKSTIEEKNFYNTFSSIKSFTNIDLALYIDSLYSTNNYKKLKAEVTNDDNKSVLKIISEKNENITNIIVTGANDTDKYFIQTSLADLVQKPYNAKKLFNGIIKTINHYRNKGLVFAEIKNVKFDSKTGTLSLDFNLGEISYIIIEGKTKTSKEITLREFELDDNKLINFNDLEKGLTNLRNSNFFENIVVTHKHINGKNYLNINLNDKQSSLLSFGFRVDNENKTQFSLDIRDINFLGTGTELGVLASFSNRTRSYIFEHRVNRLFDTYLTYNINLFYKFNDVFSYVDNPVVKQTRFSRSISGEYRQIFYGASVTVGTQVKKFGNVTLTGKYEVDEIKIKSGNSVLPGKDRLVNIKLQSTLDTQDKYPYPTKGISFKGYYETGQSVLGSDLSYVKAELDYKNYFSFGDNHTIYPRINIGFGDNTLPLSQQYSLGGQTYFFGMRDDELRGRQLFLASIGYRYKLPFNIFFPIYLKFRYDLGNVWAIPNQIRFKDLKHGIGATISFDTPIGPADFSIGRSFKLERSIPNDPISWGELLFYFSIGYYF